MRQFPALSILPENACVAEKLTWDLEKAQGWDRFWRRRQFDQIPDSFLLPIARHYRDLWNSAGERDANLYLLETVERLSDLAIHPKTSDDDLNGISKRIAAECREVLRLGGKRAHTADWLLRICNRYGIRPPPALARYGNGCRNGSDNDTVTGSVTDIVTGTGTGTGTAKCDCMDSVLGQGTIARLTDEAWWRRKLRVLHGRILEAEAIKLHRVHRHAGCYVSDATFVRVQQQHQRNRRVLAGLVAENEDGHSLPLDELIEHSLANPANRRAELMVRIYGFEQLAKLASHEAILLTVTAPSRMHAHLGKSGDPNPNFDPSTTPRTTQSHLNKIWGRTRSQWQRLGLRPYGFRITEAHHDGTPHWHILLFISPQELESMVDVVRTYALADSPEEPGAQKHRFRVEVIDPAKGSATGYIAKYISKNIDGFGMKESDTAAPPNAQSQRVKAWASTWGIRQFQQIGGPPVGLWREFRRAPHLATSPTLIGELAQAADKANWAAFVRLLGGPQQARSELQIGFERFNDSRLGRYGEAIGPRIAGIRHGNVVFSTRFHTWGIKPKAGNCNCTAPTSVENPTGEKGAKVSGLPPWSSVNNCTKRLGGNSHNNGKVLITVTESTVASSARVDRHSVITTTRP